MRKPPGANGGLEISGKNHEPTILVRDRPQRNSSNPPLAPFIEGSSGPHPLVSQVPLTRAAVAIRDTLLDQGLAFWDELVGCDGDREEIAEAFYRFEDECWCIASILKTPPLDQHIELLSAGWRCVFPLVASGACSVSYALNRLDKIVSAAELDLSRRGRDRVVDLILIGPPA
jgi:hypothetical protein